MRQVEPVRQSHPTHPKTFDVGEPHLREDPLLALEVPTRSEGDGVRRDPIMQVSLHQASCQ